MKAKLIIAMFALLSTTATAQVNGVSRPGKLFSAVDNTPPEISVITGDYSRGDTIFAKSTTRELKFRVWDENHIARLFVNSKIVTDSDKDEYTLTLEQGKGKYQSFRIVAIDELRNTREKTIYIGRDEYLKAPEVVIYEPAISRGMKMVYNPAVLKIKGKAGDVNGVKEVTINDKKSALLLSGEFTSEVNLVIGTNPIVIKAVDSLNFTSTDTFYVYHPGSQQIVEGKYYALMIGINTYEGVWPQLNSAINDARQLGEELKNDYGFDTLIYVLDKEATRKNIINKFEWLVENVKENDNLVIFYAGHGDFNKNLNKGYWVPADATTTSVADYISNNDIKTFLAGIKSRHSLLISDACFAGDIFRGPSTMSLSLESANTERYYSEVYRKPSRLALTSGGIETVSDGGKDGHSVFAYYLIKALRENNKKYLDASQLYNEIKIAITNNSLQTPMLQAIRDANDEGGQFIFSKVNQ